jgi:SdpC family antimicrobial peptide
MKSMRMRSSFLIAMCGVSFIVSCCIVTRELPLSSFVNRDVVGSIKQNSSPRYSDSDVLQYMLFSSGRIPKEHSKIDVRSQTLPEAVQSKYKQVADVIAACMLSIDSDYHETVTKGIQSGDPYKTELALNQIRKDGEAWQNAGSISGPCPSPAPTPPPTAPKEPDYLDVKGSVELYYVEAAVVATSAAVSMEVTFLAYGAVLLWAAAVVAALAGIVFTYLHDPHQSQIDKDRAVAAIASEFRSNG